MLLVSFLAAPIAAQVGYSTGFEAPVFAGSAAGTGCAGQDGFYVPGVASSIDAAIYTYAGNALHVPAHPTGGAQFYGGHAIPGGSSRSERAVTAPSCVRVDFDICCNYIGDVTTPPNNIGSFSFQPSGTNIYLNLLARWPAGVINPPATWNADIVRGPTQGGTQTVLIDTNFQGLATNVWHRWGCTANFMSGEYTEFRITNGVTNVTTVFRPGPGVLPLPGQGMPMPTAFRLFTGGAYNVFAVDNLEITYGGDYSVFGAGCPGTLGVPTLAPSSMPRPGTTLSVEFGNLALNVVIVATGFSNTTAGGGAFGLPLNLGPFGFPPTCNLLVDPVFTTTVFGANNAATWMLPIPPGSALLGFEFFNQGFSLDTPNYALTNGGRACVGL